MRTPRREPTSQAVDGVARIVVGAALTVHRALGPGLLESVYETCLAHELTKRGLSVERQVTTPIVYDGVVMESGLRLDMLVEGCLIVELKAVEAIQPVHQAQVLTYLRLTGHRLALLINFNVALIREGIHRIIL